MQSAPLILARQKKLLLEALLQLHGLIPNEDGRSSAFTIACDTLTKVGQLEADLMEATGMDTMKQLDPSARRQLERWVNSAK